MSNGHYNIVLGAPSKSVDNGTQILGCLSIDTIKWPRWRTRAFGAAKTFPLPLKRVETRKNAQERAGDVVTLFQTVLGTCRPIHEVQFSRYAVITGHSTINVGQHLHAEIGLSNASDIHYNPPFNTVCIQIKCGL